MNFFLLSSVVCLLSFGFHFTIFALFSSVQSFRSKDGKKSFRNKTKDSVCHHITVHWKWWWWMINMMQFRWYLFGWKQNEIAYQTLFDDKIIDQYILAVYAIGIRTKMPRTQFQIGLVRTAGWINDLFLLCLCAFDLCLCVVWFYVSLKISDFIPWKLVITCKQCIWEKIVQGRNLFTVHIPVGRLNTFYFCFCILE